MPVGAVIAIGENRNNDKPSNQGTQIDQGIQIDQETAITSIRGLANENDGTITWTLGFNRDVQNINLNQFSTSDNAEFVSGSLSATSGRTFTFTSRHDANGRITLNFDTNGNLNTEGEIITFNFDVFPNLLEDLRSFITTTNAEADSFDTRSIISGGDTPLELELELSVANDLNNLPPEVVAVLGPRTTNTRTYTFATNSHRSGRLVSTNNNMIIYKTEGNVGGFHTIFTGTNLDNLGTGSVNNQGVHIAPYRETDIEYTSTKPAATVMYEGNYAIGEPTAEQMIATGLEQGTFTLEVDFAMPNGTANTITGTATSAGTTSGTFSNGSFDIDPTSNNLTFDVEFSNGQSGDNLRSFDLNGNFIGDGAEGLVGTGRSNETTNTNGNRAVMGISADMMQ